MKVICYCGKDVHYEIPLDNHHTRRVPCGSSCRNSPQAPLQQAQREAEIAKAFSPPAFAQDPMQLDFLSLIR